MVDIVPMVPVAVAASTPSGGRAPGGTSASYPAHWSSQWSVSSAVAGTSVIVVTVVRVAAWRCPLAGSKQPRPRLLSGGSGIRDGPSQPAGQVYTSCVVCNSQIHLGAPLLSMVRVGPVAPGGHCQVTSTVRVFWQALSMERR